MSANGRLTVYHIPVCPFSQRLKILLTLKECRDSIDFQVIDITMPRPAWLLARTRGATALPVLETADGRVLKESLVILEYLDRIFPGDRVAQQDPFRRAVEGMLTTMERDFAAQGYRFVMNQDTAQRATQQQQMLRQFRMLNDFLAEYSPTGTFLFEKFGWAEVVFTPLFMRFWFLEYYENFTLPDDAAYSRVRRWRDACLVHPAAQQVSREEVVKLYYDYAKGVANGALLPGRSRSSFVFLPHWRERPWPPADKYRNSATDEELGL
ncbi:MAG TPA: glutathione S-transferase family protein [Accumulibacter sp.]|uniref:glutathione S-transferase family protein n=1 Tax=Accumulibacter sp. TaxID=2053492 RepID=UPI0025D8E949|nr:glutathione S-transferase family protein [Accumulibacter sp.]MCM8600159.1 glutathione S-transferase family protein [Accumulibacter sp.]MCM8663982.1 glutathione S-transferase family protein [Accumulibacter sp.]HNC51966.1 glutathione S-transferase family protein [Accumulibacter sp.]